MNVDVDKLKDKFLNRINALYNQEKYFVEICLNFPEKYPLWFSVLDLQLQIYFEENNCMVIDGKTVKLCPNHGSHIHLSKFDMRFPDINIHHNHITYTTVGVQIDNTDF